MDFVVIVDCVNLTSNNFCFQRELRERMLSKIMLLREERDFLAMEKMENDSFGQGITCLLEHYATPQEISKYHQFLEEIEQITKLTVGLTIRLGRLTRKIESGTKSREELVNIFVLKYAIPLGELWNLVEKSFCKLSHFKTLWSFCPRNATASDSECKMYLKSLFSICAHCQRSSLDIGSPFRPFLLKCFLNYLQYWRLKNLSEFFAIKRKNCTLLSARRCYFVLDDCDTSFTVQCSP